MGWIFSSDTMISIGEPYVVAEGERDDLGLITTVQ